MSHKVYVERLVHFVCASCDKPWTISDAPLSDSGSLRPHFYRCPWCGWNAAAFDPIDKEPSVGGGNDFSREEKSLPR